MISSPLVSVCIPSYNKARFIEDTLESVRRQSFTDFELLVIDDCSTDESAEIIQSWIARAGFPCHFRKHADNQGVCKTLNEMAVMARGRYFAGLGADDLWHPLMLDLC